MGTSEMTYWNKGYSLEDADDKVIEVCGHESDVYPVVALVGEEDDDANPFQISMGVDHARKLAKLLLKVADEADARRKQKSKEAA